MRPHYWKGELPIAFVFSVPGGRENLEGRPASGATGEYLSHALEYLYSQRPCVFSSVNRYAYRITNAFDRPIARSLGSASSEASNRQVQAPENVARVLIDLDGCNLVVLCGIKAQLLAEAICLPGRTIVCAWHTSNQALSTKYRAPNILKLTDSFARRQLRVQFWAQELLDSLDSAERSR